MKDKEIAGKNVLAEIVKEILLLFGVIIGYLGMRTTPVLLSILSLIFLVGFAGLFFGRLEDLRRSYRWFYTAGGHPWKSGLLLFTTGALLVLFATGLDDDVPMTLWRELAGIIGAGLVIVGVTISGHPKSEQRGFPFRF